MRIYLRWLIVIGVLIVVYGAWAYWAHVPNKSTSLVSATSSHLAPDFTLSSVDGRTVSLKDWQGHIRLLNFWATWCVPCREEMSEIDSAYRAWQDQGFVVLSINEMDNSDAALEFAQNLQLTFPILLDSDETVANNYRVAGLPTSIFIDRDGAIRTVHVGAIDIEYIENQLVAMGLSTVQRQASLSASPTSTVKLDSAPAQQQVSQLATPTNTAKSDATSVVVPTPTQPVVAPTGRLDLDTLYPLGEGRNLVLEYCAGCHGIIPVAIVRRHPGGWASNRQTHEAQELLAGLSTAQIDSMYRYLNQYRNRDVPRQKIPQELLIECDA